MVIAHYSKKWGNRITKTEELREKFTTLMGECYSQELSACRKHPIFQPQKAINKILKVCKEAGLMFTEEHEGERQDGVWWKYKVITEPIEIE